ncbi:hypothetical protein BGZ59_001865 [Podila verticillata]|nr:hypothetical protein BGZ59_001865 [Podila verticillata]
MTLFHARTGRLRAWARRTIWGIVVAGSLSAIVIPIFLIYRHEGDNARAVVEVGPQGVSHTGDYIHVVGSVVHRRSVDVTMPYMQGATIDYPFDEYKSYFEILANKDRGQLHRIPVSLTFLGMLQTVEFVPVVRLDPSDTYKISLQILTRRSPTTIGFSLFIVLIMWALSIAIGIIAMQALPALRETQPGIPAIGCAADVLGFYWNMAIIAISSIMVLMSSALRWKEPSIDHEMNLICQQHNLQAKLISEMAIPMPLPMTGGPHYEYQCHKKQIPFIASPESRNYLGHYQTSLKDEDDYDDEEPVEDRTKEIDQSGAQAVNGMEHLDEENQFQDRGWDWVRAVAVWGTGTYAVATEARCTPN